MLATMNRTALIVNPFASGVTEEGLAAVERELRSTVELTVTLTERPAHATELARGLDGVDSVFAFGGDGLLNEVLNGLGEDAVVGVLPGGRTNVVARALGVPLDPAAAARALVSARPRRISLGRANGRRFAFAAGVGFDAELIRRVDRHGRRSDGRRPGDLVFAWRRPSCSPVGAVVASRCSRSRGSAVQPSRSSPTAIPTRMPDGDR